MSSGGAAGHRAAAGAGATGASVLVDGDLDNSHSSFYGICDEQASGSVNLLILFLDVLANLLQHLLVAGLYTEEDQVCCRTGQAPLQVGLPPNLLRLGIVII